MTVYLSTRLYILCVLIGNLKLVLCKCTEGCPFMTVSLDREGILISVLSHTYTLSLCTHTNTRISVVETAYKRLYPLFLLYRISPLYKAPVMNALIDSNFSIATLTYTISHLMNFRRLHVAVSTAASTPLEATVNTYRHICCDVPCVIPHICKYTWTCTKFEFTCL